MTLLMYSITPEQIVVVTDTLSTVDDKPALFVSKCAIVPHLELAIVGTGIHQLGTRWLAIVFDHFLCLDIAMLDLHTPHQLRVLWSEIEPELPKAPRAITSTVYHFGYSEERERYIGFAYRSEEDFESEELANHGFAMKPPPRLLEESPQSFSPPSDVPEMVQLARLIRSEQDQLPLGDRLHIGGDLSLCLLRDRTISAMKIHRWEDFDDQWEAMNARRLQLEQPDGGTRGMSVGEPADGLGEVG